MTIADKFIKTFEPQIAAVLRAVRRIEEYLGPSDDWVEDDRRVIYEIANAIGSLIGRTTVSEVNPDDLTYSTPASPDDVEEAIHPHFQRNLLSTRKYRVPEEGGRQWAVGSWVLDPDDTDWQLHTIFFPRKGGGTDIYCHREASVTEPSEHDGGDELVRGDPNGQLQYQLATDGISTEHK